VKVRAISRFRFARPWIGLVLAGGCGDDSAGECEKDADCGSAAVCLRTTCVERAGAEAASWSLEIAPGPQSRFANRELPDQVLGSESFTWRVDRKLSIMAELSGRLEDSPNTPTSVGVVLAVPSSIPGRNELKFEGEGANLGAALPYVISVAIPEQLLGKMGRIDIRPKAPLDRFMCPFVLGVTLQPSQALALPGSEDTVTVTGTLGRPDPTTGTPTAYEARAFVADRLVSNVDPLGADGMFSLRVQRSLVTGALQPVRVELSPSDPMQVGVRLVASVPPGNRNLDNLMLPAHPDPAPFIVPVVDDETDRPVAGVTVIFDAVIEGAVGGQARYVQIAQTNSEGNANVRLIPGTARQTRDYVVKAIPQGASESASRCLPSYSVAAVVTEAPRVGAAIRLTRRVSVDGRVFRSDGRPAGSVRVRAVPEGELSAECARPVSSSPSEATTASDGSYRLWLDPGQYRLEYEPSSGAPLTMAAESGVSLLVTRTHSFRLPVPVLVEGRVLSPEGDPLADAEVKAFASGPDGRASLRGAATSGPDGAIRLVLPKKSSF
jgi:hypothetical protein